MKKARLSAVAIVCAGLSFAGWAQAQSSAVYGVEGSLALVADNLIKLCTAIPEEATTGSGLRTLHYVPYGNSPSEDRMRQNLQAIAPMSRVLVESPTTDLCADPDSEPQTSTNHQMAIGREAVAVITHPSNLAGGAVECENLRQETAPLALSVDTERNSIAGIQCPGCSNGASAAGTYTMTDWKDVLKLAYFGVHHDGSTNCNSDVRWELLNDFRNLSNDGVACSGASCGAVNHLWRMGDLSAAVDPFRGLLGVSSGASFCNGTTSGVYLSDELDGDPIRRSCKGSPAAAGADQVCGCDGKLGVVQAINVPAGYTTAQLYTPSVCGGARALAQVADSTSGPTDKCLAGLTNAAGTSAQYSAISQKCVVPLSGSGQFGCRWQSTPITLSSCDNRVWNRELRDPATGTLRTNPASSRPVRNAVFRIRPECQHLSSIDQIACLAQIYSCSAGWIGLKSWFTSLAPGAVAFRVDGDAATEENMHANLDDPTRSSGYRLTRKGYLNSVLDTNAETAISGWEGGFTELAAAALSPSASQFTKDQAAFVACAQTPAILQQALEGGVSVTINGVTSILPRTEFFPPFTSIAPHITEDYTAQNLSCDMD